MEYLQHMGELRPGESVPDHWFDLASSGRAGVRRAADALRDHFPDTATAMTELVTDVRVARFTLTRNPPRTGVGLFYLTRAKDDGRPLALLGFPPNPSAVGAPTFWPTVAARLRGLAADVHDGLVVYPQLDCGPVPSAYLQTLDIYAQDNAILDNAVSVEAYLEDGRPVGLSEVPPPPKMVVAANNGINTVFMFEISDPQAKAWSFGETVLLQSPLPIDTLLDDMMAERLISSCLPVDSAP
ncbi:hypothetical protein ABLE92_21270 [Gordonia sp. VNQ95]|uniref:hypothetical protein n=1 Tax=Gordonia TaxID=2053 RepID=UPI0032B49F11